MSKKEEYAGQVRLLLRLLPFIDRESCFALKGDGNNLFKFLQFNPFFNRVSMHL